MPPVDDGRTELAVRVRCIGHGCLIDARGEVDASTVADLHVGMEDAARARGPVVADLCAVSFLDSVGLHALLVFRQRLLDQGRRFAIAYWPDGAVAMALSVSGTDSLFAIHPDRDAAAAALDMVPAAHDESSHEGLAPDAAYRVVDLALRAGAGALAAAMRTLRSKP